MRRNAQQKVAGRIGGSRKSDAKKRAASVRTQFGSLRHLAHWLTSQPGDLSNAYYRPALAELHRVLSAVLKVDAPAPEASDPCAVVTYGTTRVVIDLSGHDGFKLQAAKTALSACARVVAVLEQESKPVDGPVFASIMKDELRWHLKYGVATVHETKF